ncbi:MAG: recombinase [Desulfocapsaceae bacterium]|nr:recombinase [Desulfocapsaceae bacterium]MDD3816060.1 recombinase [Desulfocapsaceae bacterium]MDO8947082.1 recombinase [Desulfocapsaceae bacterium]
MEKEIKETPIQRQKLTKEEILERKISMVKERGSRVMKINSPMGSIMFNILQQFDQAYAHFKGQLGEPGGISHEEGGALMDRVQEITMDFSEYTGQLSKKVKFKYFMPQELQELRKAINGKKDKLPAS